MSSIWIFMKKNVSCGSRQADVVRRHAENNTRDGKYICRKKNSKSSKLIHGVNNPICSRQHDMQKQYYYELKSGDVSRNIIEIIFQRASLKPIKQSGRIKTVLKVNNSLQTLERFENYREMVKRMAYEGEQNYKSHTRSMVDGNELLRFYGTTMACCCQGKTNWVSEFCKEPTCGVCRMIQSAFDMDGTKKNGIQMSSSSEGVSDMIITNSKNKSLTRAVIVCRIIAGRVGNKVDGEMEERCNSFGSERWDDIEYLILKNPNAVLPCYSFHIICIRRKVLWYKCSKKPVCRHLPQYSSPNDNFPATLCFLR